MDWTTVALVLGGGVLFLGFLYILVIVVIARNVVKAQKKLFRNFDDPKRKSIDERMEEIKKGRDR